VKPLDCNSIGVERFEKGVGNTPQVLVLGVKSFAGQVGLLKAPTPQGFRSSHTCEYCVVGVEEDLRWVFQVATGFASSDHQGREQVTASGRVGALRRRQVVLRRLGGVLLGWGPDFLVFGLKVTLRILV